jgi:hypothetical protein
LRNAVGDGNKYIGKYCSSWENMNIIRDGEKCMVNFPLDGEKYIGNYSSRSRKKILMNITGYGENIFVNTFGDRETRVTEFLRG